MTRFEAGCLTLMIVATLVACAATALLQLAG